MFKLKPVMTFLFAASFLSCSPGRKTTQTTGGDIVVSSTAPDDTHSTKKLDSIQVKYAAWLHASPEQLSNIRLYRFIDQWLYTPYKWGGTDKDGIDCSAFLQLLFADVYHIEIPRTSVQQFFEQWIDRFGSAHFLSEGDLVFFQTIGDNAVSHVGLYLCNHMFVNSSSSKGVSIASLDDPYWKSRFVAAGRIKRVPPVQSAPAQ